MHGDTRMVVFSHLEVFEEFDKVARYVKLICSIRLADREASANWLFDPKHIRQVYLCSY